MILEEIKIFNKQTIENCKKGKLQLLCQYCQNNFYTTKGNVVKNKNNFCSKNCFNKFNFSVSLNCSNCNKLFEIKKQNIRKNNFCSNTCKTKYLLKQNKPNTICKNCNIGFFRKKLFLLKSEQNKHNLFCSKLCFHIYKKNNKKQSLPKIKKPYQFDCTNKLIEVFCELCNKNFLKRSVDIRIGRKNFCDKNCHNIYQKNINNEIKIKNSIFCSECNKQIYKPKSNKYKHRFCNIECRNNFFRKKIITENHTLLIEHKQWRKFIFARDIWRCQECGSTKKINAHHIRPVKNFKELRAVVDNGITLCQECHLKTYHKEELFFEKYEKIIQIKKILITLNNINKIKQKE